MFWLDKYHIDGLRVDAVASMLYLDYSRKAGEWIPNQFGGRENLEAIDFLRRFNEEVLQRSIRTCRRSPRNRRPGRWCRGPTYLGGLGFGLKWDMGWMHDTLEYLAHDPDPPQVSPQRTDVPHGLCVHREFRAAAVARRSGPRQGLAARQDARRRLAEVRQPAAAVRLHVRRSRARSCCSWAASSASATEWNHDSSLDWPLLESPAHSALRLLVGDLNHLYRSEAAMHDLENDPSCFEWLDSTDAEENILSFLRKDGSGRRQIAAVFNFSPVPRPNYRMGVPQKGLWKEILNSDAKLYGGSGRGNFGGVKTVPVPLNGRHQSLTVNVPPLGAVFLRAE